MSEHNGWEKVIFLSRRLLLKDFHTQGKPEIISRYLYRRMQQTSKEKDRIVTFGVESNERKGVFSSEYH